MKKPFILSLKIIVSIALLTFLFVRLDTADLWLRMREASAVYVLVGVLFSFMMVAVSCWKWWLIMRYQGHPLPFTLLYRWYFIGYFYSNFLPSNVGGDVARAWLAGRRSGSGSLALISIFAERITGLLVLLGFAVFLPFLSDTAWRHPAVWTIAMLAATMLLALLLLLFLSRYVLGTRVWAWGSTKLKRLLRADQSGTRAQRLWDALTQRAMNLTHKGDQLWQVLKKDPKATLYIFLLTILFYAMTWLNVVLAYRAFGAWPMGAEIAWVLPTALLVAMIPVSLGNLGIAEGAYVFYFGLAGMAGEWTLAMGLFLRLKVWLLGAVGLLLHQHEPLPQKDLHGNREET